MLERSTPLDLPTDTDESEGAPHPAEVKASAPRKGKPVAVGARKVRGRTVYIPDDLFERIIVQAHRKDRTISEYVVAILERQVPDHRLVRTDQADVA